MANDLVEFSEEKMALIKKTIAKGCTNEELQLFIHSCKRFGLDPLLKQIYAVKRGDTMTIQTGIDGYRLIAERSGKYMPGKEPTFTYDKDGKLFSATSYVKKIGPDGVWHEIACTAIFTEYAPIYNGKIGGMWKDKGHLMLAKCAEAAALRRGFPAEMSGVYTDEEMEQADSSHVNKHTGEIEIKKPIDPITVAEAVNLHQLIGDDKEYLNTILTTYKATDFTDIDRKNLAFITERVQIYNAKRLEKELSNV